MKHVNIPQKIKQKPGNGFTLVELLVVVAIIGILAAIALPNFLEAQTRSKVSRVHSDLRTLATALEAYSADNNSYPPVPIALGPRFRRFRPLTTPISYLTSIPRDPFDSTDPHGQGRCRAGLYIYGALPLNHPSRWILASDGPDRHPNLPGMDYMFYPGYTEMFEQVVYDPTNGTVSVGDIHRASDHQ